MKRAACLLLACVWCVATSANASVPTEEGPPVLRPPHAELTEAGGDGGRRWMFPALVFAVAACGVLGRVLRQRLPAGVPAPLTTARAQLRELAAAPPATATAEAAARIVRAYVAAQYPLPEGELTTAEIERALLGNAAVPLADARAAGEFLRGCDRIKFGPDGAGAAPVVVAAAELITRLEAGRKPAATTTHRRAPAPVAPPAPAGNPATG